jgi:hypothetical protein
MLKKVVTFTSIVGAALAASGVAYYVAGKQKSTSAPAQQPTLTGLREWNSTLAREIVRSHRDARDVCIAVLTINGVNKDFDVELYNEIEQNFAKTVRGSDLLAGNDTGEFFVLFPEAGLDEGYEAVERLQETLPPTVSLAAGIAVWDHCETAAELVARTVASMQGEQKSSRGKIAVSETPQSVHH